ncbi:MAG: DUF424 family protein [Candidatus Pacearchaeota archaeon]
MLVKIHKSYRNVVSICDSDLLGKKFQEGKIILDVKEVFFKGKEINEEELIDIINKMKKEDATFNIVGEKSVNIALKCGLIDKEGIKYCQEIPFALVLL